MRLGEFWKWRPWRRSQIIAPDPDYPALEQVIQGYLHQDMHEFHETISDALAEWARMAGPEERGIVVAEVDAFLARQADPDAAFVSRWGMDLDPPSMGRATAEFLQVLRKIAIDPASAGVHRERW